MIKKCIVSMALLGAAVAAQAGNFMYLYGGFYIDQVDAHTGGYSMVHWDDGSLTWANHFAVYVAPSTSIIGSVDPDYTIPDWITPVANGGATFQGVELFARWGQNNEEVFATSMGTGYDFSWTGAKILVFPQDQAAWQVTLTPVTSVPEPETYALMLAGLGVMGAMARRRKEQRQSA